MLDKEPYLSFINDEDLFECISGVYQVYYDKLEDLDYDEFVKNKIDPFKMMFDLHIQGLTIEEWVEIESNRQIERAVSNAIGYFHEALISKISNFEILKAEDRRKYKVDLIDKHNHFYVEVKNKHNTVKGEDRKSIFEKLEKITLLDPDATCIFLNILGTSSKAEEWEFSSGKGEDKKKYSNPKIFHYTGDKFYSLITGNDFAFAELCSKLPQAIRDFEKKTNLTISYKEKTQTLQAQIINSLREGSENRGWSMEKEIVSDSFKKANYLGFTLRK